MMSAIKNVMTGLKGTRGYAITSNYSYQLADQPSNII